MVLCLPSLQPRPAAYDYIDRIVTPAKAYGLAAWYIERLEDYRS